MCAMVKLFSTLNTLLCLVCMLLNFAPLVSVLCLVALFIKSDACLFSNEKNGDQLRSFWRIHMCILAPRVCETHNSILFFANNKEMVWPYPNSQELLF
jgi:hypothetical protein